MAMDLQQMANQVQQHSEMNDKLKSEVDFHKKKCSLLTQMQSSGGSLDNSENPNSHYTTIDNTNKLTSHQAPQPGRVQKQ
jgi:hypothetical protein